MMIKHSIGRVLKAANPTFVGKGVFIALFALCAAAFAHAQVELPRLSPKASVSYTVGLTTITINYSSPAVNDREIWGNVVPFGEIWRAGANEATTVEFSTDVNLEGKQLEAGKYALFVIPKKDANWSVILNKDWNQWGPYNYDESKDALRVDVEPQFVNGSEDRLEFTIHDKGIDRGYIRLAWDDMRLYLRFLVDVLEPAMANVDNALENAKEEEKWMIYAEGANFLLDNEFETRQAMEWADKSTQLYDHSWNWWIKAKAQAASGDYSGAIESAMKSKEVGSSNPDDNFYANMSDAITSKVAEWKAKVGG